MLQGLSGPIDGKTYAGGVMAPMAGNRDEWIADVSSFIRSSFGNATPAITPRMSRASAPPRRIERRSGPSRS